MPRVWRLEWKALPEICLMTGAILAQMKYILQDLEVRTDKMRANLDVLGGFLLSERVMFALADKVGKQSAHEMVYEAAMRGMSGNITFEQALMADGRSSRRSELTNSSCCSIRPPMLGLRRKSSSACLPRRALRDGWIRVRF